MPKCALIGESLIGNMLHEEDSLSSATKDPACLIQLTKDGSLCGYDLGGLRQEFSERNVVRFPQLLHSDLMAIVWEKMQRCGWRPYEHGGIGKESLLDNGGALAILRLVANTPAFLQTVEEVTQCGPISVFDGRVYRMSPTTDHYDSWHTDGCESRLIGMSLNLGAQPYYGGLFQLRKRGSPKILCELPNIIQGDAILFRISPELEHRITPMEGAEPKTAFAGWFRSGATDLFSQIRGIASRPPATPKLAE